MAKKLKLGVLGMSEGNGHPYSWSAIFNGYDPEIMKDCPFPAIPDYLGEQKFPEDSLGAYGEVTHIWTQDRSTSEHIARASKIAVVVDHKEDMIGEIDAVLLARDDAENHYKMALPFLKAAIPVFIDKPLALSIKEASKLFDAQEYPNQIFTCTSLRFAKELKLSQKDLSQIGLIKHVEASVPKKWDTYAVHIIEPIIAQLPERGKIKNVIPLEKNGIRMCLLEWENISSFIKVTGSTPSIIKIEFFGDKGNIEKRFSNAYESFKASLEHFVLSVNKNQNYIDRTETLEVIKIIENGRL